MVQKKVLGGLTGALLLAPALASADVPVRGNAYLENYVAGRPHGGDNIEYCTSGRVDGRSVMTDPIINYHARGGPAAVGVILNGQGYYFSAKPSVTNQLMQLDRACRSGIVNTTIPGLVSSELERMAREAMRGDNEGLGVTGDDDGPVGPGEE